jgi:hypothetical protein
MEHYEELSSLLQEKTHHTDIMEGILSSCYGDKSIHSLDTISKKFRFETEEEFDEIKGLIADLAIRRVDSINYKLCNYSINKVGSIELEEYYRLKLKFEPDGL